MSFDSSLRAGALGEAIAWDWLINNRSVRQVIDVRFDEHYQAEDVDFLVERTDRQFFKVEVKTDLQAASTGNIAYELTTSGNVGCLAKTKADVILYYVVGSGNLYSILPRALRAYVEKIPYEPRKIGDAATGYLIRIDELILNGVMKKVDERYVEEVYL